MLAEPSRIQTAQSDWEMMRDEHAGSGGRGVLVNRIGRRVLEAALYVMLFLLPFSMAAVEIGFGIMLLGWILERWGSRWQETAWSERSLWMVLAAMVGYLVVCAASVAVSDFPQKSLTGLINKWLEYLVLFVMATDLGKRPEIVKRAVAVLVCSSVFVVLEGVWQELFGKGLFRGYSVRTYWRMTGPYTNPNDLAIYLMVILLVLIAWSMTLRVRNRLAVGGWVLILVACLARTEAQGPLLGLAAGFLAAISRHRALRWSGVLIMVVTLLCAAAFLQRTGKLSMLFSRNDIGTVDRIAMWKTAVRMIKDRPILGHGLNTFMARYLDYWVGGQKQPRYAHNCYLQVAAETGLLGLGSFLWLLWCVFCRIRAALHSPFCDERLVLLGLYAGLVAFSIQAALDTNFYSLRQAALFWVLAGLAMGLSERITDEARTAQ